MMVLTLIAVAVSFTVSASAGLGGSLVLVPILALVLGTKEGVALAALLLAANNVVKLGLALVLGSRQFKLIVGGALLIMLAALASVLVWRLA